jgi:hypothetical protein
MSVASAEWVGQKTAEKGDKGRLATWREETTGAPMRVEGVSRAMKYWEAKRITRPTCRQ